MLRKQNNLLRLFYKTQSIFFISILVVANFFFQNSALAMISSQLCDKELDRYCPTNKYNSAKLRLKCIEEKKKFFTYECVVRILGLPNNNNELKRKAPWLILPEEEKDLESTKVEVDPLKKKHNQSNNNSKSTVDTLEEENLVLKDVMLRTNCLSDMSRLCKMKTRKGVAILKEPLESCMNKMIKRESRLTLSCHASLLNILSKSNKQYTHYNVNGITIHHRGDRLKRIDKRSKENHIDSVRK